jgi:hypothetical protein
MDWILLIFCLLIALGVGMVVVGYVEKNKHKSNKQYHTNLIIIGAIIAGIGLIAVIIKFIFNMRKKNAMKNMNFNSNMGYDPNSGMYGPQDMGYDPNSGMYGPQDMGYDPNSGIGFDQYGNPFALASAPPVVTVPIPVPSPPAPVPVPVVPSPAPPCNPQPNNCCNNSMPMNPFNMNMNPMMNMGMNMNPMMNMGMNMNPMMQGYGMPWMYPQPPVFKIKCSKDD